MIGNLLNLSQQAIDQRFQQEIPDLVKLVQSRLKLKNPADLTRCRRRCASVTWQVLKYPAGDTGGRGYTPMSKSTYIRIHDNVGSVVLDVPGVLTLDEVVRLLKAKQKELGRSFDVLSLILRSRDVQFSERAFDKVMTQIGGDSTALKGIVKDLVKGRT